MIFIIKVTTNKEEKAVDMIADRAEKKNLNTYAVLRPHGLRGYILLEAEDRESAEESVFNLPYVKGIMGKTVTYEEIKNMIEPSIEEIKIEKIDYNGDPDDDFEAKIIVTVSWDGGNSLVIQDNIFNWR